MRVFIAGIMQGSLLGTEIVPQDYRREITAIIAARHPEAQIVDPWDLHPESLNYGDEEARQAFLELIEHAGQSDILVAYLPEASMGTALEMWRAHERGIPILTISPLAENWVVKFLSAHVFADFHTFADFIGNGGLEGYGKGGAR